MDKLTKKEVALAGQLAALHDTSTRPTIAGGGMLGDALNFVSAHVPPMLVKISLLVFLGYHAWSYYNQAQQMVAQVESKQGEAMKAEAEADSLNNRIGADSAEAAKLKAELTRLQADSETAKAEYEAQSTIIGGVPARLATVKAEIEKTQAEASKVQYEVDALRQQIDGMPMALAQKKSEVEALEAKAQSAVSGIRIWVQVGIYGYGAMARSAWPR